MLLERPTQSFAGLAMMVAGLVVYGLSRKQQSSPAAMEPSRQ
jgi:hypothetical protein